MITRQISTEASNEEQNKLNGMKNYTGGFDISVIIKQVWI